MIYGAESSGGTNYCVNRWHPINGLLRREINMLGWALTFLVVALIAGILGFGGIAAVSVEIAQILFVVFLVLFVIAALVGVLRGKAPPV